MKLLLIGPVLLLGLMPAEAPAQDHLEPYDPSERYHVLLREVFPEGRDSGSLAQAIIIPSFSPEISVSIRRSGASYELIVLRPKAHFWRYELAEQIRDGTVRRVGLTPEETAQENAKEIAGYLDGLPSDPKKVRMDRCTAELDSRIAKNALKAWATALSLTRETTPEELENDEIVLDGTGYDFWSRDEASEHFGSTRSGNSGRAARLAALSFDLVGYCDGKVSEANLRRSANRTLTASDSD